MHVLFHAERFATCNGMILWHSGPKTFFVVSVVLHSFLWSLPRYRFSPASFQECTASSAVSFEYINLTATLPSIHCAAVLLYLAMPSPLFLLSSSVVPKIDPSINSHLITRGLGSEPERLFSKCLHLQGGTQACRSCLPSHG